MDASPPRRFSAADFRSRTALLDPEAAGDHGDHRLNPELRNVILRADLRDAAVLVPIVDRGAQATVLLTKRTDALRSHSGQVAFPGGRIDPQDASPEAAALREATEEIGLDPRFVETVGRLPDYVSGSGFRVAPILGVVNPGFALTLNPDEVDAAFEVPLGFLMDPANHALDSRIWQGKARSFYRMPFENWMIWGLSAGIIHALYESLYA